MMTAIHSRPDRSIRRTHDAALGLRTGLVASIMFVASAGASLAADPASEDFRSPSVIRAAHAAPPPANQRSSRSTIAHTRSVDPLAGTTAGTVVDATLDVELNLPQNLARLRGQSQRAGLQVESARTSVARRRYFDTLRHLRKAQRENQRALMHLRLVGRTSRAAAGALAVENVASGPERTIPIVPPSDVAATRGVTANYLKTALELQLGEIGEPLTRGSKKSWRIKTTVSAERFTRAVQDLRIIVRTHRAALEYALEQSPLANQNDLIQPVLPLFGETPPQNERDLVKKLLDDVAAPILETLGGLGVQMLPPVGEAVPPAQRKPAEAESGGVGSLSADPERLRDDLIKVLRELGTEKQDGSWKLRPRREEGLPSAPESRSEDEFQLGTAALQIIVRAKEGEIRSALGRATPSLDPDTISDGLETLLDADAGGVITGRSRAFITDLAGPLLKVLEQDIARGAATRAVRAARTPTTFVRTASVGTVRSPGGAPSLTPELAEFDEVLKRELTASIEQHEATRYELERLAEERLAQDWGDRFHAGGMLHRGRIVPALSYQFLFRKAPRLIAVDQEVTLPNGITYVEPRRLVEGPPEVSRFALQIAASIEEEEVTGNRLLRERVGFAGLTYRVSERFIVSAGGAYQEDAIDPYVGVAISLRSALQVLRR